MPALAVAGLISGTTSNLFAQIAHNQHGLGAIRAMFALDRHDPLQD
jgi:hypothetical protein